MNGETQEVLFSKKTTDALRGIAAIIVVLSHYADWWSWFTPSEGFAEQFRLALAKLGDYGVAIFFLFSGYAMVKSLKGKRVSLGFVGRRIKNVYIPYLIVIGAMELWAGGFTDVKDFFNYASGFDHWYMFILFSFYIAFFLIWGFVKSRGLRVILMSAFAYGLSYYLFSAGMQEFWYSANFVFIFGVIAAEYEEAVQKFVENTAGIMLIGLTVGMYFVITSGMKPGVAIQPGEFMWSKIGAVAVWSLLVAFATARLQFHDPVMPILGRSSLYIYLTHTFIFMRVIDNVDTSYAIRFLIAAVLTIVISLLLNLIMTKGLNGVQKLFASLTAGSKSVA